MDLSPKSFYCRLLDSLKEKIQRTIAVFVRANLLALFVECVKEEQHSKFCENRSFATRTDKQYNMIANVVKMSLQEPTVKMI